MGGLKLIYGENTYLVGKEIKAIKKNFGQIVQGINYVSLEPETVENIIPELQTPPFGYEQKLIIVKNCDLLKKELKTKKNKNSELIEKLVNYIEENANGIFENVTLIVVEDSADKNNSLYKTIEKYGQILELQELKPMQLVANLKSICKAYKVDVDDETLKYLIEKCGTSLQELINEIRKLIEYAGEGGKITKKEVDLLAIPKIEAVIFDLTDSLGTKNIDKAMEVLNNLIYNKEPVQKILITLYNHFKKLYLAKLALNENTNLEELLNLKPNQSFLVAKYKKQAQYFEEKDLRKILEELTDLDANSKIGLIDLNVGLEAILCNI